MTCIFDAWKNGAGMGRNNGLSLAPYLCMNYLKTLSLLRITVLNDYNNNNNNNTILLQNFA